MAGIWTEWATITQQRKVLYNNASGSNGTIDLSDNVTDYDSIEIFFRDENYNYGNIKIPNPINARATLCCYLVTTNGLSYHKEKSVYIGESNITLSASNSFNEYTVSASGLENFSNNNKIYITKVIGIMV